MKASYTIIEGGPVKGLLVLGISKEEIENIVDIIEMSHPMEEHETETMLADANHNHSWVALEEKPKKTPKKQR